MTTSMHRLQISLTRSQVQYVNDRARREGISIAELIRRLVQRESAVVSPRGKDSLREIIGIGIERKPLINNVPVSEQPDLYIFEKTASYSKAAAKRSRKTAKKDT